MDGFHTGHDEIRLTREAFPAAELDPRGAERARARLLHAIELERVPIAIPEARRRHPAWRWGSAVAALVVLALMLSIVLPNGSGGPPMSAARELRALARVAAAAPPLEPGQFAYSLSVVFDLSGGGQDVTGGTSYERIELFDQEIWVGADLSGRHVRTYVSARFASPADEERWKEMGSRPVHHAGDRVVTRYAAGELNRFHLDSLPTDPEALKRALEQRVVIDFGEGDDLLFLAIEDLLAQGGASPELRAALFQVAATLPDAQALGIVRDPFGREGVGISVPHSGRREIMIFDPTTAAFLATESEPDGTDTPTGWTVYLASGVVDKLGARPKA